MAKTKVAVTLDAKLEVALVEKLARLDRSRLARECAKLDPDAERAIAEEGMGKELASWPAY
jgi:hypothetical protein